MNEKTTNWGCESTSSQPECEALREYPEGQETQLSLLIYYPEGQEAEQVLEPSGWVTM